METDKTEKIVQKPNLTNIIGLVVIVAAMGFGLKSLTTNLVPYIPFAQAKAEGAVSGRPKTVQVMGGLEKDSVVVEGGTLLFTLVEKEKDGKPGGETIRVRFKGQSGPNFKEAIEVTAIGHYEIQPEPIFIADKILTKCPSKYQGVEKTEQKEYRAQPQ
jgi:cytochrome c-type biogenesis protein CcmE